MIELIDVHYLPNSTEIYYDKTCWLTKKSISLHSPKPAQAKTLDKNNDTAYFSINIGSLVAIVDVEHLEHASRLPHGALDVQAPHLQHKSNNQCHVLFN